MYESEIAYESVYESEIVFFFLLLTPRIGCIVERMQTITIFILQSHKLRPPILLTVFETHGRIKRRRINRIEIRFVFRIQPTKNVGTSEILRKRF